MMPITNTTNDTTYDIENDPALAGYIDIIKDGEHAALHGHMLGITKDGQFYVFHHMKSEDECIERLTHEGAWQWLMDHGAGQEDCSSRLDELFPTTMAVSIRVPKDLWERLCQAIRQGRTVPVNRLLTQLLEQELESARQPDSCG
jgi:hypothetical protein